MDYLCLSCLRGSSFRIQIFRSLIFSYHGAIYNSNHLVFPRLYSDLNPNSKKTSIDNHICAKILKSPLFLHYSLFNSKVTKITQICKNMTLYNNPLSANPTKWSNTLKQFVGNLPTNCLSVLDYFVKLALKGISLELQGWKV